MSKNDFQFLSNILEAALRRNPDMIADDALEAVKQALENSESSAWLATLLQAEESLPTPSEDATAFRRDATTLRRILNDPQLPMALVAFEDNVIFGETP